MDILNDSKISKVVGNQGSGAETAKKTENVQGSVGTKNADTNSVNEKSGSLSKEEVKALISELNHTVSTMNIRVKFEYSDEIDGLFINVIDAETDSVIRRFPSKEAVNLSMHMKEILGILLDKKL